MGCKQNVNFVLPMLKAWPRAAAPPRPFGGGWAFCLFLEHCMPLVPSSVAAWGLTFLENWPLFEHLSTFPPPLPHPPHPMLHMPPTRDAFSTLALPKCRKFLKCMDMHKESKTESCVTGSSVPEHSFFAQHFPTQVRPQFSSAKWCRSSAQAAAPCQAPRGFEATSERHFRENKWELFGGPLRASQYIYIYIYIYI